MIEDVPSGSLKGVIGDANVRWHARLDGGHVFGKGKAYLQARPTNSPKNRELAWDVMIKHGLKNYSSFQRKPWKEKATYRDWGALPSACLFQNDDLRRAGIFRRSSSFTILTELPRSSHKASLQTPPSKKTS